MPTAYALLAALAFGLSAPLAKLLLGAVSPLVLAGLLYAGAGLLLTATRLAGLPRGVRGVPLGRRQLGMLAAVVLAGGVLAPPLLLWGLNRGTAGATALLLNLEVVFTVLLAGALFREHLGGRVIGAAALIAIGGVALEWRGGAAAITPGALAVAGACALWALDNNLTRLLAESDPVSLVQVKGLAAGAVNLALAAVAGSPRPGPSASVLALALGGVSYGGSLVLYVLAMRGLGAARAGAYFALAPFVGAAGAVLILREPLTPPLVLGGLGMAAGVFLLFGERHVHRHRHEPGVHTHRRVHDEHHRHAHEGWEGPEPHVHPHGTGPFTHEHRHAPDLHHRHGHGG